MNEQHHILISGRDTALLATRGSVLRKAGYRVSTTREPISSHSDLSTTDLLLICHTLSEEEREEDLSSLKAASPSVKALCLVPHAGEPAHGVATLDSYGGPREMLRVVSRLLTPLSGKVTESFPTCIEPRMPS